jgi:integrase
MRFHDLRHTCASFLIDEGRKNNQDKAIIASQIMTYLGHDDIKTTLNIYAHWLAGAQEALAASLAERYRAAAAGTAATAVLPRRG